MDTSNLCHIETNICLTFSQLSLLTVSWSLNSLKLISLGLWKVQEDNTTISWFWFSEKTSSLVMSMWCPLVDHIANNVISSDFRSRGCVSSEFPLGNGKNQLNVSTAFAACLKISLYLSLPEDSFLPEFLWRKGQMKGGLIIPHHVCPNLNLLNHEWIFLLWFSPEVWDVCWVVLQQESREDFQKTWLVTNSLKLDPGFLVALTVG